MTILRSPMKASSRRSRWPGTTSGRITNSRMQPRRVVITGLGVLSSLGSDKNSFWQALSSGQSGIRPLQGIDASLVRFPNAAEVQGYDPSAHFEPKEIDLLDRFAQFAVIAAREAITQSRI